MSEHPIDGLMSAAMSNIKDMVDVNTIVGNPVTIPDGTTIIPISKSYHRMLYRKLIYTGITRAKKKLILIGEAESFVKAVNNNLELVRKTSLKEKMIIMNNN